MDSSPRDVPITPKTSSKTRTRSSPANSGRGGLSGRRGGLLRRGFLGRAGLLRASGLLRGGLGSLGGGLGHAAGLGLAKHLGDIDDSGGLEWSQRDNFTQRRRQVARRSQTYGLGRGLGLALGRRVGLGHRRRLLGAGGCLLGAGGSRLGLGSGGLFGGGGGSLLGLGFAGFLRRSAAAREVLRAGRRTLAASVFFGAASFLASLTGPDEPAVRSVTGIYKHARREESGQPSRRSAGGVAWELHRRTLGLVEVALLHAGAERLVELLVELRRRRAQVLVVDEDVLLESLAAA